ncbi:hypothetical protein A3844_08420 [Paenibacillus helianthi]|uniref:Holin n=1 Tax=Paenibacillus helianthi TaxID=1349432 RepID=A0ABX3ETT2_9BACL|nr:phage holin family protein [Paenibacillus helianthi]OKP88383.1 hypothetical protein A3844_08420 [Paenibacillus helianthi]
MLNHIKNIVTTVYTAAVGSGTREIVTEFLVVLMLADYVSGVAGAFKTKTVSSDIMFWGGVRKITVLFVVGLAALIDDWVQPGAPVFRLAAILYYAGREGLSVIENFGVIGVPWPQAMKDFLLQLSEDKSKNNPAKPEHPDYDQSA